MLYYIVRGVYHRLRQGAGYVESPPYRITFPSERKTVHEDNANGQSRPARPTAAASRRPCTAQVGTIISCCRDAFYNK